MKSPSIPKILEEWEFETINELIKYVDIESENFDFKKEPSGLHEDICAMSNTQEGFIVLGVSQIDSEDGTKIIRFEKTGFEKGEEDVIKNTIGNYAVKVEPLPTFEMRPVYDKETNKFFMIIKIESKITDRPFFIKTTDQCFIRIHNSSRRVGRNVILNLYGASFDKLKNIQNLRASSIFLKKELSNVLEYFGAIHSKDQTRPPPIDLSLIKNALQSTEWFLTENNLLRKEESGVSQGITYALHIIEQLNEQIRAYNTSPNPDYKYEIQKLINHSNFVLHSELQFALSFLDTVIKKTDEFLTKYSQT